MQTDLLPPPSLTQLEALRRRHHAHCFACGQGLFRLEFELAEKGALEANLHLDHFFTSYEDSVHGGALALFIDQAVACCLFAHGICAVTANLEMRFRRPVRPGGGIVLRTWVERQRPPLFTVRAEIQQESLLAVRATAEMWRCRQSGEPKISTDQKKQEYC